MFQRSWFYASVVFTATATAAAQPAPPAPAPEPAPTGAPTTGFTLREAPTERLVGPTGKEALAPVAGGLTADTVATRARAESPEVRAKDAAIRAAAAKVDRTVVSFLPRLKVSATYRRVSPTDAGFGDGALVGAGTAGPILVGPCTDPALAGQECALDATGAMIGAQPFKLETFVNYYSLNASLSVPISDYLLRLSSALEATKTYQRAAELNQRAAALTVQTNARIAYYNWLRAVAAVAVAESSVARTRALFADTQSAFELGAATRADVLRLEALVASVELMVTETKNLRLLAGEQLATLMEEPTQTYRVGEDVLAAAPAPPPLDALPGLVAQARRKRLEVEALRAAVRALDQGMKAARVSQYPRLDAFGDFTYARPNPTIFPQQNEWKHNWALGVSLSYTLNDPLDSRTQMAELEAQRAELEANRSLLERGLRLEVTAALAEAQKARAAVATAERGALAADEAYRVARELYRAGRATTTDLISAESELVQASLREVNALLDVRVADVKLTHATAADVPGR